jgi:uncharacterized DUF497 family protein
MRFEWDAEKSLRNARERGLPFEMAERMDWATAVSVLDARRAYGEARFSVMAPIDGRLCVCVYTLRDGRRRIISLRKANARERATHERRTETTPDR